MNTPKCRTLTAILLSSQAKKEAPASLLLEPFFFFSAEKLPGWETSCEPTCFFTFGLSSPHSLPILFTILLLLPTSRDSPGRPILMLSGYLAIWLLSWLEILTEEHSHMIGTWSTTSSADGQTDRWTEECDMIAEPSAYALQQELTKHLVLYKSDWLFFATCLAS